jgi:hypothetical protein
MRKTANSDKCIEAQEIAEKLRNLNSSITHAKEIEQDLEVITRSLKEREVDCKAYPINESMEVNITHVREILSDSNDFHIREFSIFLLNRKASIVFLKNMTDEEMINNYVIEKLALPPVGMTSSPPQDEPLEYLKNTLLTAASITEITDMDGAVRRLLSGDTMLIVDGVAAIIMVTSVKMKYRAISEPETEANIHAARDGFTEGLQVNVTLIRRRLKNPNLIVKIISLGVRSETDIAIVYYRGIVNPKLVYEVEQRLKKINIDATLSTGTIQGIIEDHPYSPFPTLLTTERPDKFAASLVEGKVGIVIDGTPFCLLAPAILSDFFQAGDDYNEKWLAATVFRVLRYVAAVFAMVTPALFIAITTFHPGLIPAPLAITIAVSRLGIPFPVFVEALIMEFLLEVLQEAGVRLPKTIGPAVSIVGGLVIGEATVRAGFVSAPIVIVTAFTAIASFNIANYRLNLVVRLLRIPLMVLGASFGMFGVMVGLLTIAIHLSTLESFGIPYLSTLLPKSTKHITDLKDAVLVVPPFMMKERPVYLEPEDGRRQGGE